MACAQAEGWWVREKWERRGTNIEHEKKINYSPDEVAAGGQEGVEVREVGEGEGEGEGHFDLVFVLSVKSKRQKRCEIRREGGQVCEWFVSPVLSLRSCEPLLVQIG